LEFGGAVIAISGKDCGHAAKEFDIGDPQVTMTAGRRW
jgi:hypothetical protein